MKTLNSRTQKISFATRAKNSLLATTMLTAVGIVAIASPAKADNWTDLENVGGSFTTDTSQQDFTHIYQSGSRAAGKGDLDITEGHTVKIHQGKSSDLFAAYDVESDPTYIFGNLEADGRVLIIDTNGVFYGPNSSVDVNSIITTTGNVAVADVMDGDEKFEITDVGAGGKIDIQGTITVADAGLAAFVAPQVSNSGVINARVGKVALAAGEKVTLDLYGDNLVEIAVDDKVADALIENSGRINAQGGQVVLTAQAAKDAVDNVINTTGVIDVSSVSQVGGKIILSGGKEGTVNVGGQLKANGEGGGNISVKGHNIVFGGSAEADGGTNGNGGDVVVFADNLAVIEGRLSARGGTASGNGGFIETSAAALGVSEDALIDAYAFDGEAGLWLIDPLSIVISDNAAAIVTVGGSEYTNINSATVSGTLSGGTNVTIQTGVNSAFTLFDGKFLAPDNNEGDIRVRSNITHSGASSSTLSLISDGDISVENNADITATGAGSLNVDFLAKGSLVLLQEGDITVNNGSEIVTNGGYINFTANDDVRIHGTLNSAGNFGAYGTDGGNIFLTANGPTALLDGVVEISKTGFVTTTDNLTTGSYEGNLVILAEDVVIDGTNGTRIDVADDGFDGLLTIGRSTNGNIGLGNGAGGLQISQAEMNAIDYTNVEIGNSNTSTINVKNFVTNSAHSIPGTPAITTLITGLNDGNNDNVNFAGTNAFNSLIVKADDNIVFADNAVVDTTHGGASFYGDQNNATVGDFIMGAGSRLDTNSYNVYISALNLLMNSGSEIDSEGGNIEILTRDDFALPTVDGEVTILGGLINADGGDILIDNRGIFYSEFADSVTTHTDGTIDINQWEGGSIQNAIDAVENTGSGWNTIHVGPGTFAENVRIYEDNFRLWGNNVGIDPNTGVRTDETIVDGGIGTEGTAYAFLVTGNNSEIDGFTLTADGNGVRIGDGTNPITKAVVQNNIIDTTNIEDVQDAGVQGYNVTDATVQNNYLSVIGNNGVSFVGGKNVTVSNNVIGFTDENGIVLSGVNGSTISGNIITQSGGYAVETKGHGIAVYKGTGVNEISDNDIGLGLLGSILGDGIHVEDTAGITISGNEIDNTGRHGIFVDPSPGTTITKNIINNSGLDGIHLDDSINSFITDNEVYNSGEDGIGVNSSGGTQITGNWVDGIAIGKNQSGIEVTNSKGVHVEDNDVMNSSWDGIGIWNSSQSKVLGNRVTNVGLAGVAVSKSNNTLVDDNTITTAGNYGVWSRLSDGVTISNNVIDDVVSPGPVVAAGVVVHGGSNVTVTKNTITNTNADGVRIADAGSGIVVSYNDIDYAERHGVFVRNTDGVHVLGNNIGLNDLGTFAVAGSGDGVNVAGGSDNADVEGNNIITDGRGVSLLGGDSHKVHGNTIETISYINTDDEGIYADATSNANIYDNHITTADNHGISIDGGSNATVNHNDIHGAYGHGILVDTVAKATVTNNSIENTIQDGIHATTTSDLLIQGNYVGWNDFGTKAGAASNINGNGITVIDSNFAKVLSNNVIHVNGDGIYIDPSDDSVVDGNILDYVFANSIHVDNSDRVQVTNNIIGQTSGGYINPGFGTGDGILIENGSDYAYVNKNLVSTDGRGVSLLGGTGHEVSDNDIDTVAWINTDDQGIYAHETIDAKILINDIHFADNNGISVVLGKNVNVDGNTVHETNRHGIVILSVDTANVNNNFVKDVRLDGINVNFTKGLNMTGNTVYNTGDDGIDVNNSHKAYLGSNAVGFLFDRATPGDANNIGSDGIQIINSDGVTVFNSYITNTTENGIYVDPSDDADLDSNIIYDAGANGILVDEGTGHYIHGNHIFNSNLDGIHVQYFGHVNISFNEIDTTGDDGIETHDGNSVWIEGNDITNAGYWADGIYRDAYGADGIHVRNVSGPLPTGNYYYGGYYENAGNGDGYGPFGGVNDYNVVIVNNNIGVLASTGGGDDEVDTLIEESNVNGAYDDGIEVVGDNYVQGYYGYGTYGGYYYGTGRTLIGWNNVANVGLDADEYAYDGGPGSWSSYGADGIHVRGINSSYYGYPVIYALDAAPAPVGGPDDAPAYGPDGFGYAVEIVENTVNNTGDDGIEVLNSPKTIISGNEIDNTGLSYDNYYDGYYGYYGYNAGDGIHVSNVHDDDYEYEYVYGDYGYYGGYYNYSILHSVEVLNNDVSNTGDDGIHVEYSGRTLIGGNTGLNAGWNSEGYAYGDYTGADGIRVNEVYANEDFYSDAEFNYFDNYDVQVIDNTVTNSDDDGIEVTYQNEVALPSLARTLIIDGYYGYYGSLRTVNVIGNDVDLSGDDGIDVTNANFVLVDENEVTNSGGDGITVNRDGSDWEVVYAKELPFDYGYYGYYDFPNHVVITDNTVDQSGDDGIEVQGYGEIEIGRNIVTNSGDDGVIVHDLLFAYPYLVEEPDYEYALYLYEPGDYYAQANVNIHENTVDNSGGDGIQVDAYSWEYESAGANVYVTDNKVSDSGLTQEGGANGLYLSGPLHNYSYVAGNTFLNNPVGANFESGLIDLTGPGNQFLNGQVGLFFNPFFLHFDGEGDTLPHYADMALVDDDAPGYETHPSVNVPTNFGGTIGAQFFSGQSEYFVELGNQAFWDFGANEAIWLNGLNSTYVTPFGTFTPADTGGALPLNAFNFLEDRFYHYPDTGNTGIFWFGFIEANPFDVAQEDLFTRFNPFSAGTSGLNITLLGLPTIPGGGTPNFSPAALNAINTFAGAGDGGLSADELNAIETAAGGDAGGTGGGQQPQSQVTCWTDATTAAVNGQPVNYSYGTDPDSNISDAAACSVPSL